ncbi:MAG TPA: hypothetical protein VJM11_16945 [Nevskiaceae bacterium]|nr:hypothetical protein [Nevskiaceae bacterium]
MLSKSSLRRTALASAVLALSCGFAAHGAPGDPFGPPFAVNVTTAGDQQSPAVAMDAGGNFVVVWDSAGQDGSLSGIFGRRFAADGTPLSGEFQVNTYTADRQISPRVARDALGNFVVTWRSSGQDGNGGGVYAQRFASDGSKAGPEFQVNSRTSDSQTEPSVAMNASGQFVIAWSSRTLLFRASELDRRTIDAQVYDAQGVPVGQDRPLAEAGAVEKTRTLEYAFGPKLVNPSIGMDERGRFVATWLRDAQSSAINAELFGPMGNPYASSYLVSDTDAASEYDLPQVAMAPAGHYVVVWERYDHDRKRTGLFGKRYNRTGQAQGAAFRIDDDTRPLARPSVSMDAAGNFVVAGDTDGRGIFMRRYAANGTPLGALQRVSPNDGFVVFNGRVSATAGGNFVVVWQSYLQDGAGRGIYARRYAGP